MPSDTKNKGGRPKKLTEEKILDAISGSAGIKTTILKRLNVSLPTLNKYIDESPSLQQALKIEEESVLDMAEGTLYQLIQNGDAGAIFYFLNNKGKSRGYGQYKKGDFDYKDDEKREERETGVLVTPGMLTEETWEAAVQKPQQ